MLISMTPNEEVKTIHASLNDGSLRKWEFEPYTEQGKIELTDQDYATIQSIKGNTVKFNQLVQNGNFADNTVWYVRGNATISNGKASLPNRTNSGDSYIYQDNIPYILNHKYYMSFYGKAIDVISTSSTSTVTLFNTSDSRINISNQSNQKYSTVFTMIGSNLNDRLLIQNGFGMGAELTNIQVHDLTQIFGSGNEPTTADEFETWLSTHLGNLDYYGFTLGDLISFNGTGIKTLSPNKLSVPITTTSKDGIAMTVHDDGTITFNGTASATSLIEIDCTSEIITDDSYIHIRNQTISGNSLRIKLSDNTERAPAFSSTNRIFSLSSNKGTSITNIGLNYNSGDVINMTIQPSLEETNEVTSYEPYISNTLSLPISTYFPTGMKEAGSVYDELTESKAITRLRYTVVDGTNIQAQYFGLYQGHQLFFVNLGEDQYETVNVLTIVSNKYVVSNTFQMEDKQMRYQGLATQADVQRVNINRVYWNDDDYTSASAMNTALQSNPLEIISLTESETSQDISLDLTYPVWDNGTEQILPVNGSTPTTAPLKATIDYPDRTEDVNFLYKQTTFESAIPQFSLVCKNQELPMTLENDKLICECDSSITNESGFFDCKVKMQDLDSVAYSQKIQLHVERGIND